MTCLNFSVYTPTAECEAYKNDAVRGDLENVLEPTLLYYYEVFMITDVVNVSTLLEKVFEQGLVELIVIMESEFYFKL